jgi:serine/threonine-protein kinase
VTNSKSDGRPFGSRYRLGERIGAGTFGVVHLGEADHLSEPVAIKLLHGHLVDDSGTLAAFLQERKLFQEIDHPNVVRVHDLIVDDEVGIVMEYVSGGDLQQRQRANPLSVADAAALAAGIGDGLAAIHDQGIVHGDLKPANVLLTEGSGVPTPKITDFSMSRLVSSTASRTSMAFGTPLYVAPEIVDSGSLGPALDQYSLGVVLFELLAGRPPFESEHVLALLRKHAETPPPRLTGCPPELTELVEDLLAKDPGRRPTAAEASSRLRDVGAQLEGVSGPLPITEPDATSEMPTGAEPAPATVEDWHDTIPVDDEPGSGDASHFADDRPPPEPRPGSALSSRRLIALVAVGVAVLASAVVLTVNGLNRGDTQAIAGAGETGESSATVAGGAPSESGGDASDGNEPGSRPTLGPTDGTGSPASDSSATTSSGSAGETNTPRSPSTGSSITDPTPPTTPTSSSTTEPGLGTVTINGPSSVVCWGPNHQYTVVASGSEQMRSFNWNTSVGLQTPFDSGPNATLSFDTDPGSYPIAVTVNRSVTARLTITVTEGPGCRPEEEPQPRIEGPGVVDCGDSIFYALVNTSATPITEASWQSSSIGISGRSTSGATLSFTTSGANSISVTVNGSVTTNRVITVGTCEATGPDPTPPDPDPNNPHPTHPSHPPPNHAQKHNTRSPPTYP